MLWIKSFHIVAVVAWFAGLFYMPRLFVYHAMTEDEAGKARFKIMERKLFYGIMTPAGVIAVALGVWLWLGYGFTGLWLHLKLALVAVLIGYHGLCGKYMLDFKHDRNRHGHGFYRWFNEFPILILVAVVLLVELKPA
jgi:putative membrane protein